MSKFQFLIFLMKLSKSAGFVFASQKPFFCLHQWHRSIILFSPLCRTKAWPWTNSVACCPSSWWRSNAIGSKWKASSCGDCCTQVCWLAKGVITSLCCHRLYTLLRPWKLFRNRNNRFGFCCLEMLKSLLLYSIVYIVYWTDL